MVAGQEDRLGWKFSQSLQTLEHFFIAPGGEVGPAAIPNKEHVARQKVTRCRTWNVIADFARSVPRGVNRKDSQISDFECFFIKDRLPGPLLDLDSEFFFRMHVDGNFWEKGTKFL